MQSRDYFKKRRIHLITQCSLFASLICIFSPFVIPVGPIPITLGLFAVMLTGIVLDVRKSLISVLVYVLLGVFGLPVFSGAMAGFGALIGPTGGYIWSYLPCVCVISVLNSFNKKRRVVISFLACLLGIMLCYISGTLQYMLISGNIPFLTAIRVCVYPFIVFDVVKAVFAVTLGMNIKKRLVKYI